MSTPLHPHPPSEACNPVLAWWSYNFLSQPHCTHLHQVQYEKLLCARGGHAIASDQSAALTSTWCSLSMCSCARVMSTQWPRVNRTASFQSHCLISIPLPHFNPTASFQSHSLISIPQPHFNPTASFQSHCLISIPHPHVNRTASCQSHCLVSIPLHSPPPCAACACGCVVVTSFLYINPTALTSTWCSLRRRSPCCAKMAIT